MSPESLQLIDTLKIPVLILLLAVMFRKPISAFLMRMNAASSKIAGAEILLSADTLTKTESPETKSSTIVISSPEKALIEEIHWDESATLIHFINELRRLIIMYNMLLNLGYLLGAVEKELVSDANTRMDGLRKDAEGLHLGSVVLEKIDNLRNLSGADKQSKKERLQSVINTLGFIFDYVYALAKQKQHLDHNIEQTVNKMPRSVLS